MERFLIDSDVLIDVSRVNRAAIDFIDNLPGPWMISQISSRELVVGARNSREVRDLHEFLSAFPTAALTEQIGERAYSLLRSWARSYGLHVFDSLIAATAIEKGLTLETGNSRHFRMIEGLTLMVPEY